MQHLYGKLKKNDKQRPGTRDPELMGTVRWEDRHLSIAGWVNTSAKNVMYITITFRDGEGKPVRVGNLLQNHRKREGYADPDLFGDLEYFGRKYRMTAVFNEQEKCFSLKLVPLGKPLVLSTDHDGPEVNPLDMPLPEPSRMH